MKHHQYRVMHISARLGKKLPLRPESDGSAELGADPNARARRLAASISTKAMKRGVRFLSTPKDRS